MKHIKLFEGFVNEETIKGERGLSLNIQHDYITLKTPVGSYTSSRSGAKASGQLSSIPGAFKAIDNYVETAKKSRNMGEIMKDLLDPKLMDKLVPGWDKPKIVVIEVGDSVRFEDGSIFKKKYPDEYKVYKTSGKYAYITVPKRKGEGTENIGFEKHALEKVETK